MMGKRACDHFRSLSSTGVKLAPQIVFLSAKVHGLVLSQRWVFLVDFPIGKMFVSCFCIMISYVDIIFGGHGMSIKKTTYFYWNSKEDLLEHFSYF